MASINDQSFPLAGGGSVNYVVNQETGRGEWFYEPRGGVVLVLASTDTNGLHYYRVISRDGRGFSNVWAADENGARARAKEVGFYFPFESVVRSE